MEPARPSAPQHARRIGLAIALTVLIVAPTTAWASHQFTDVPDSNTFHADIDWMADNGVTLGCNPPANDQYCPDDFVTREQMAAFMHRLESQGVFHRADEIDPFTPIASFRVRANGVVRDAEWRAPVTGEPTSFLADGSDSFVVTIPGVNFNINEARAVCYGMGTDPVIVTVGSSGGNLRIYPTDETGTGMAVRVGCLVYRA